MPYFACTHYPKSKFRWNGFAMYGRHGQPDLGSYGHGIANNGRIYIYWQRGFSNTIGIYTGEESMW